jgi:hypothetical protein
MELYQSYSKREIMASLAERGPVQSFWNGQLLVASDVIVCATTLGDPSKAPHFPKPAHFCFRPTANYDDKPADLVYDWMPKPLANNHQIGRGIYLFVNQKPRARFTYVGELVDGMNYCGGKDYRRSWVNFFLAAKLPRELWLRFGGHPAWKVTVNHRDLLLGEADHDRFDRCVTEAGSEPTAHLILTRYQGDSLKLLTNQEEGYLTYEPEKGAHQTSLNRAYPKDTEKVTLFQCTCGICLEIPRCYAIPKQQAMEAISKFFRSGRLPSSVEWAKD